MAREGPGGLKTTLPIATYPLAHAGRFQGDGPWTAWVFWHADCDGERIICDGETFFGTREAALTAANDAIAALEANP